MEQTPPFGPLITRARLRVAELIRMLNDMRPEGGGLLSAHAIALFVRTILEPAESILRHMLLLMAAELLPLLRKAAGPPAAAPGRRKAPAATPPIARAPLFRLFDTPPRPAAGSSLRTPAGPRAPRAASPDLSAGDALAALNAGFEARLAALTAAALDPDTAARRLLARLRRERPATCRIRTDMPEGLKQMRTPTYRDTFHALTAATGPVWLQLIDSS
ncbi:MAG: hypothetical protein ACK4HR_08855 [Hyphomonas sp.]|jgi:hypothetical protein